MNLILAIDTSCDETSAAVTCGRKVLSNVISSQINIHKKYGGVFPVLAKRAHQEKIDYVVNEAIKRASIVIASEAPRQTVRGEAKQSRSGLPRGKAKYQTVLGKAPRNDIFDSQYAVHFRSTATAEQRRDNSIIGKLSAVAVTQGPGLAIALEVGIKKAKELALSWQLPLISVNHLEGHLYSCLAQNINGQPEIKIEFPVLGLIVSGGHTELVLMEDHLKYRVLGETLDDACGEALDKGARILKLGYPGGPIIERLAEKGNPKKFSFNLALKDKNNLNFSYSGLKTQLLYRTENMAEIDFNTSLNDLAASYQSACFEQIIRKTSNAINIYQPKTILCGGGVIANTLLRKLLRNLASQFAVKIYFPQGSRLTTDNAAMIGIAAGYKLIKKDFIEDIGSLDREPRMALPL